MTKEVTTELLRRISFNAKIKINHVLEWSKQFQLEGRNGGLNGTQVAALVLLHEKMIPFSGTIGETMCEVSYAQASDISPWLRSNFRFREEDIYDMLQTCMKSGSSPGPFSVYDLNTTYEIIQSAALKEDHALIEWLLRFNVEVDRRDSLGCTALHVAAQQGNSGTVEYLLKKGASIFVMDSDGNSPFELAFDDNHFQTADLLHPELFVNKRLFLNSVESGNCIKISYLWDYFDIRVFAKAIQTSAKKGIIKIVEQLLQHDQISLFIDDKDEKGNTPLALAVKGNFTQVVESLLTGGASLKEDVVELAKTNKSEDILAVFRKLYKNPTRSPVHGIEHISDDSMEDDFDLLEEENLER